MTANTEYAQLRWDEQGRPVSSVFDDIYFSKANGLEETRYVFLQQNQLEHRWRALPDTAQTPFVIAETGFGSGLNFLAAWQLWQVCGKPGWLHFVSVEKYPLSKPDLQRALALWPELHPFATLLLDAYPEALPKGVHRLNFPSPHHAAGGVALTLIINDAAEGFADLHKSQHPAFKHCFNAGVDAWFLDGFAPAKNPDMWTDALFAHIASLSKTGTTVATFTCAGLVKRGLQQQGFTLKKVPGYGHKREMLTAALEAPAPSPAAEDFTMTTRGPTYPIPWDYPPSPSITAANTVTIIGGGLAGCMTAHQLAQRGIASHIIEAGERLATAASGNLQGVIYAKLSLDDDPLARYNLSSLQYALRFYAPLFSKTGARSGVLQLGSSDKQKRIHQQLAEQLQGDWIQWLTTEKASEAAGIPLQHPGLFFPDAGWVSPPLLCRLLVDHPLIRVTPNTSVDNIAHNGQHWLLATTDAKALPPASHLVIANATDAKRFAPTHHLPLKPIRGQVTHLQTTALSEQLNTVVCADGYVAPANDHLHTLGATFNLNNPTTQLRPEDHHTNLDNLVTISQPLAQEWASCAPESLPGKVGFRCTTPDYLPLVGPAPVENGYDTLYAPLRSNAKTSIPATGPCWPNLYVNVGYGSRGLTYAPLAADYLADIMLGTPPAIGATLAKALHPGRFLIRQLRRKQR